MTADFSNNPISHRFLLILLPNEWRLSGSAEGAVRSSRLLGGTVWLVIPQDKRHINKVG